MNRAHMSMWGITSALLFAGNDVRSTPPEIIAILTDNEAIAINQLYAGNAGDIITSFNKTAVSTADHLSEVWVKPLPNRRVAAALLNRAKPSSATKEMTLELSD